MKAFIFLIFFSLGFHAQAIELDGVICRKDKMSYRFDYQNMQIVETVDVMPGVITGEVRYEQEIKEQVRTYKNDGSIKKISYKYELMDGSTAEFIFELKPPSKSYPLGYPVLMEGSYKGVFSKNANVILDECSVLLM